MYLEQEITVWTQNPMYVTLILNKLKNYIDKIPSLTASSTEQYIYGIISRLKSDPMKASAASSPSQQTFYGKKFLIFP